MLDCPEPLTVERQAAKMRSLHLTNLGDDAAMTFCSMASYQFLSVIHSGFLK
jgi:hypothetical protein